MREIDETKRTLKWLTLFDWTKWNWVKSEQREGRSEYWRVKWPEGMSEEPAYIHSSIQFIECDEVKATQHEFNLRLKKARRSSCRNSIYTSFRCVDAELKLIECRQWTKRAGAIPFQFHFHFIHAALMREMKRVKWNWRRERQGAATPINCLNSSRALKREWMGINGLQAT